MSLLKIARYPDEETILRTRCRPVLKITDRTRRLMSDMIETMYDAAGVGLAAPQVFHAERLFVYDVGDGPDALINPEILYQEGEDTATEGCLSIPRLQADVTRATRVVVAGLDRRGKRVRIEAEDYLARVFQHEIDHLNGILFTDRAIPGSFHFLTEEEEAERRREGRKRRLELSAGASRREPAEPAPRR